MSREDSPPLLLFAAAFLLVALTAAIPAALSHSREAHASAEPRASESPRASSEPRAPSPAERGAGARSAEPVTAAAPSAAAPPNAPSAVASEAPGSDRPPATAPDAGGDAGVTKASASASAKTEGTDGDGPGFLTISSAPPARVTEHGRVLCTSTPCAKLPLSAGAHTITLENKEESLKNSIAVTITSGETTSKRVTLKP